ncbi:hypothetical protein [Kitasatospora cheerisanensis]|uniref:Uncharacterized protein n=1 Tax=Kitasatospora cheerisanensis KCTC 2395 TaxID=1348663 RepID=A0A066YVN8_9ACTN|nr:hypothetical protein [Kitasatospora cheerisanensis]KDN85277.1 hypothetical protein KCH_28580 [Kitasatospora cheerisanensis KCTC 2395]
MATGVPQYRRPTVQAVLPGSAVLPVPPAVSACTGAGPGGVVGRVAQYDTVTVPVRHGLEAVDILRLRRACGAVQQTSGGSAIAFLVPPGTALRWHLPGSTCTSGADLLPPTDPRWIIPPSGPQHCTRPTDAWVLRSALCEAATTLTAGGLGPL